MTILVHVDGRPVGTVEIERNASQDDARTAALAIPRVADYMKVRSLKRFTYHPGRIIGIVTCPRSPPN